MNGSKAEFQNIQNKIVRGDENLPERHLVVLDYAGVFEDKERLTCCETRCGECTLVRQPWMGKHRWNSEVKKFKQMHPFDRALTWEEYYNLKSEGRI